MVLNIPSTTTQKQSESGNVPRYAILVIQPDRYVHSHAFDEVVQTLKGGLQDLGYPVQLTDQPIPGCRHIVFGAHLLFMQGAPGYLLPPDSILYNLEQIDFASPTFNSDMLTHFQHWAVWDYSQTNIGLLQEFGISNVQHLPIGYHSSLSCIPPCPSDDQDIDVLFYGSLNERRQAIIQALEAKGLKVKVLFGVYGKERDDYIRRAKIVLNVHFYQSKVFEVVRVSYLLANQKFVISECGTPDADTEYFEPGLVFADYDSLVDTCIKWLGKSEAEREAIALQGFRLIQKRPISDLLPPVLKALPDAPLSDPLQELLRVDLGCGARKAQGYFGVDICPAPGVDRVANLNKAFPFENSSVDELRAHDVIEHLPDRLHTMNEIWRVCKHGALVDLLVPSTDGRGAFQDPTHVSFWNINSFQYYAEEYPEYLKLCQQYGFKGAFNIVALKEYQSPGNVIHVHTVLRVVKDSTLVASEQMASIVEHMRSINYVVFPDWQAPEAELYADMKAIFKVLAVNPHRDDIAILVDRSQLAETMPEFPESLLAEVYMDLMLNEGLEVDEHNPELSFLSMSDYIEWDNIKERLTGRITFAQENQRILSVLPLDGVSGLSLLDVEAPLEAPNL